MRRFCAAFLLLALLLALPALAVTEEEMDAALEVRAAEAMTACFDEGMTDLEKLTALHDWLALHCDYGAIQRGETAYGALVEGQGNCMGYAAGLAFLADRAGLEGTYTYSEELDHAWALVTLDGGRYFSDCTWDDGKYQKMGLIRHRYFLFDEGNAGDTGHYSWDSEERVPGGALEAVPWTAAITRVIFTEDSAYYIDREFRLVRCGRDTWETEVLFTREERWPDTDPEDGKEPELYTGLVYSRGRLYFNTPERLCYYELSDGTVHTALTPARGDRYIYGVGVRDGRIVYTLAAGEGELLYDVIDTNISARLAWGY